MIDRLMTLPLIPLLMTIALSNTALALIVLVSIYNNQPVHIGPAAPGVDWHGNHAN